MTLALTALALLLGALCLPFWIELTLEEDRRVRTRVHWPTLRAPPFARPPTEPDRQRKPARSQSTPPPLRKIRALLRSPDFLASLVRLARRILAHLRPRHLRLHLKFGLGDPADTGRAWGALTPLLLALCRLDAEEVRFEPDFTHRTFDVRGRALVRIVPGVLLALVAGYFLTRAPWRALARYARA